MMKRLAAAFLLAAAPLGTASAEPAAYDSPEAAVEAVISALNARDRDALLAAFGPEHEDILFSGDQARDRADWTVFLQSYNEMNRIAVEGDTATLHIGTDQWPAPIPVRQGEDGKWRFDAEAGREEIAVRRIGENELDVMELLRAYVRVQAAYRQIDYDGDGVMEFANSIISDEGERNGLYWPQEPGAPESPIGAFIAQAAAQGHAIDGEAQDPEPYLGYYFLMLDRQGESAPGGAREYAVNGHMVSGHAMLAFPSAYGDTGIMSFLVGENGIVYEQDFGEETLETAIGIEAYDPGEGWAVVE
ncbi:MAG: DUF2950 domain-containing protein [Pseudomonadota bacterium]